MQGPGATLVVKKYGNRRLYDTQASAYITLEELAERVRRGADVRVVDAKTDADLTQSTLAQVILESRRGADLLPVPLLVQLIRMGDDALAEFFGRYVSFALEMYVGAKQGFTRMPYNPFAGGGGPGPFGGMFPGFPSWPAAPQQNPPPQPPPAAAPGEDVASLRRELDELKAALKRKK
jgi:polyhydroxyalkanoate synthesis repressor PhaR